VGWERHCRFLCIQEYGGFVLSFRANRTATLGGFYCSEIHNDRNTRKPLASPCRHRHTSIEETPRQPPSHSTNKHHYNRGTEGSAIQSETANHDRMNRPMAKRTLRAHVTNGHLLLYSKYPDRSGTTNVDTCSLSSASASAHCCAAYWLNI
jgi:hypothetical protein